jgi:hypothetical protein
MNKFFLINRFRILRAAARFRSTNFNSYRFVIRGKPVLCIKSHRPRVRFFASCIVLMVGPGARYYNQLAFETAQNFFLGVA